MAPRKSDPTDILLASQETRIQRLENQLVDLSIQVSEIGVQVEHTSAAVDETRRELATKLDEPHKALASSLAASEERISTIETRSKVVDAREAGQTGMLKRVMWPAAVAATAAISLSAEKIWAHFLMWVRNGS